MNEGALRAFAVLGVVAALAAASVGCLSKPTEFRCSTNAGCGRIPAGAGTCEATHYCSFPDDSCDGSGRRYPAYAGAFSGTCVGSPADAGSVDADAGPADHATAETGCDGGRTMCGGLCVDLDSDQGNCGSCGRNCVDTPCQDGLCQATEIATAQPNPVALVLDAERVYWVNRGLIPDGGIPAREQGSLMSVKKTGEDLIELRRLLDGPNGIAMHDGVIYTTGFAGSQTQRHTWVLKRDVASGVENYLWTSQYGMSFGIAVDGENVFWGTYTQHSVMGVGLTGDVDAGVVATVSVSGLLPRDLATAANGVVWLNYTKEIDGVIGGPGSVMKVVPGNDPVTLAEDQVFPLSVAVDSTNAYWVTNGAVMKVGLQPDGGATQLAKPESSACATAVDEATDSVYWVGGTRVWKVRRNGGTAQALAVTQQSGSQCGIAVDRTHVFWTSMSAIDEPTDQPTGKVLKVAN
jgi:hypothetical protein